MANIEIVPTTPEHIVELLHNLQGLPEDDAYRFGVETEDKILKIFKRSIFVDSALVDGKIVGLWGVLGDYMGQYGRPWSLLSPEAEKYPFRLTSFYRKAINKMLHLFPVLVDMVDVRHTRTLRMLKIMGFTFSEPEKFMNGLFIRATRRA